MIVCHENHSHMIKPDGSLWHGNSYLVPELEKQGWRQVVNPKRDYYSEFDQTHPSFREQEIINLNEDTDVLQVERI